MTKFKPEQVIFLATLQDGGLITKHTIKSITTHETGCSTTYDFRLKGFAGTQYDGSAFYETEEEARNALLIQAKEMYQDQIEKIKTLKVVEYP